MKIFIAWSKGVSKEIGLALKDWLQKLNEPVFRTIISEENIPVGAIWDNALDVALRSADYGILCVTEENLNSLWLCYESGALRMSTAGNDKENQPGVAPILFGDVSNSQIANPLQRFQSVKFDKAGMKKLVLNLNTRSARTNPNNYLDEKEIEARFEKAYPLLKREIQSLLRKRAPAAAQARKAELMAELGGVLERLESLNAAGTGDTPADGIRSPALDEFEAALTEFQRYENVGQMFKTLSMMGNFLLSSVRQEGFTDGLRAKASQYRDLLRRSQNMTDAPAPSRAAQRILNALSALL